MIVLYIYSLIICFVMIVMLIKDCDALKNKIFKEFKNKKIANLIYWSMAIPGLNIIGTVIYWIKRFVNDPTKLIDII